MAYFLQQFINAVQLGSIYALVALGYSMVYGVLRFINFAHGDIFMVGALLAYVGAGFLLRLANQISLPGAVVFVGTMLFSMAGTTLIALLIEKVAYRPLRQYRLSVVITALGMGVLLEHLALVIVGPWRLSFPLLVPNHVYRFAGVSISTIQLLIIFVSLGLMILLEFLVQRTKQGIAMRAISYDRETLPLMGVSVNQIVSLTFAISSCLAAAGGLLYGHAYPIVEPYMGITVGWKSFISAVVGGIGSIRGAVLGGFILGFVEIGAGAVFPSRMRDLISFVVLMTVLLIRPTGIYGVARRQKV